MSDAHPARALNAVADALTREYGHLPLSVRYRAAAAACDIVQADKLAARDAERLPSPNTGQEARQ